MRKLGLNLTLLLVTLSGSAQTVRDLIRANGVPESSFSKTELEAPINGVGASSNQYVFLSYIRIDGEKLTGGPQLVRYDKKTGAILRPALHLHKEDDCCGSPDSIEFAGQFILLRFEYNPSASSILVLNKKLQLVETFYGLDLHEVAPNQIVLTEGMMHFAPVHAERLQFVDLPTGSAKELYPPKDDPLRSAFVREQQKNMPPEDICKQDDNDYCDPSFYDEDIEFLGTDGHGQFALIGSRNASHVKERGGDPVTIASQSGLYLYGKCKSGWCYCAQELSQQEEVALTSLKERAFSKAITLCTPSLPVEPDMTMSDLSPFPKPDRQTK